MLLHIGLPLKEKLKLPLDDNLMRINGNFGGITFWDLHLSKNIYSQPKNLYFHHRNTGKQSISI